MGLGGPSIKKCVIEAPKFKENLQKLMIITNIIEKLAQVLAKSTLSGNNKFQMLPEIFIKDRSSLVLLTDSFTDNAAVRYNAFVGFYRQMDKDTRRSNGERILNDLIQIRQNLSTNMANLCQ